MTARRLMRACLAGSLVTLPWIGMGAARLATGRDWGAGLQLSWLLAAGASVLAVAASREEPWSLPAWVRRWGVLTGLAVLASVGGLWLAPGTAGLGEALARFGKQIIQLVIMICFAVWPILALREDADWQRVARLLWIGALLQATYGAGQWWDWYHPGTVMPRLETVFTSNPSILSGSEQLHLADGFRDVPRLRGTAAEPLYLGNYLLAVLPLLGLTGWSARWRLVTGLAAGLLLVMTWSRGAWLGGMAAVVAGGVLPGGWMRRAVPRRVAAVWAAGVLVVVVLAAAGVGPLALPLERLTQSFSTRDWSNLTRLYSMEAAWRAYLLSPVVGIGWGQFAYLFPLVADAAGLQSQFTWPVVNNFPLQILCETGLPGAMLFAAGVVLAVRAVVRRLRRLDPGSRDAVRIRATAVAAAAVWIQLLTFSQYNLPHIWLAPGLLAAALASAAERPQGGRT